MRPQTRTGRDQGSAVIEVAIGAPALMLFIGLIIFAGRVAIAHQGVQSAAADAARSASISRTQGQASTDASAAATSSLTQANVHCARRSVSLDTTGFASPVGTPAFVAATVTCVIELSDLSLPGIPGSHTVRATVRSPLDTYRQR